MSSSHLALVIGNADYPLSKLKNPVNDARAMAARLEGLGFEVLAHENAKKAEMAKALVTFKRKMKGRPAALVYFAGHGLQVDDHNWLIPVDAEIEHEDEVSLNAIKADDILAHMDDKGMQAKLLILDACRDNPFERKFRGAGRGLAHMSAPKGSLIAYATSPGKTASDGEGDNGLYTSELLKVITTPGLAVEQMFKQVRKAVIEASDGRQVPWEATSLVEEFHFVPASVLKPADESAHVRALARDAQRRALEAQKPALLARDRALAAQAEAQKAGQEVKDGYRVVVFSEGGRYEGEWRDGAGNGSGVNIWPNGNRYEGEVRDGERNGFGANIWVSGQRYEGEWRDDERDGLGVQIWADGARYEGEWRDGKRTGRGVELAPSGGIRHAGFWKDNDLIAPFPFPSAG